MAINSKSCSLPRAVLRSLNLCRCSCSCQCCSVYTLSHWQSVGNVLKSVVDCIDFLCKRQGNQWAGWCDGRRGFLHDVLQKILNRIGHRGHPWWTLAVEWERLPSGSPTGLHSLSSCTAMSWMRPSSMLNQLQPLVPDSVNAFLKSMKL